MVILTLLLQKSTIFNAFQDNSGLEFKSTLYFAILFKENRTKGIKACFWQKFKNIKKC